MGRNKCFDRNEVLDLAIQLFWKKGFADTSLSDLEKTTGVNKSGLYSEFKDKDDIFFESIKRYQDTTEKLKILNRSPLGWKNIEDMIYDGFNCKGQKGCFLVNSLRDYTILPSSIKKLIDESHMQFQKLLIQNLEATGTKKDIQVLANLIGTFATGIGLKLNVAKPKDLLPEVEAFFNLIKS